MHVVLLPVGDDLYAVDVAVAREVVSNPVIVPLPTALRTILGMCNLRGEIIPVFDTAALLGLGSIASVSHAVIVETTRGPAGLATTGLGETLELGEPDGVTDLAGTVASYNAGTRLVVLVDVDTLVAAARVTT